MTAWQLVLLGIAIPLFAVEWAVLYSAVRRVLLWLACRSTRPASSPPASLAPSGMVVNVQPISRPYDQDTEPEENTDV